MTASIVIGCVRDGKTRVPTKPPRLLYWRACYAPLGNACPRGMAGALPGILLGGYPAGRRKPPSGKAGG
jgi:hypothetical protein